LQKGARGIIFRGRESKRKKCGKDVVEKALGETSWGGIYNWD